MTRPTNHTRFRNVYEDIGLVHDLVDAIDCPRFKKEMLEVSQSIADALREVGKEEGLIEGRREGRIEGKKDSLTMLLRHKFASAVTPAIESIVHRTTSAVILDEWLLNLLTANTLKDIGIRRKK